MQTPLDHSKAATNFSDNGRRIRRGGRGIVKGLYRGDSGRTGRSVGRGEGGMKEVLRRGRSGIYTDGVAPGSKIDSVDCNDAYNVQVFRAQVGNEDGCVGRRDFANNGAVDLDVISVGCSVIVLGLPVEHETIRFDASQVNVRAYRNLEAE